MPDRYDVIIVGARCAGATLAIYLARQGASVLVLDRDPLPSDQVLSTHVVHAPGMDVLDEVGVGDAVRAVAPAMRVVRLRKNDGIVDVEMPRGREEYCPRRASRRPPRARRAGRGRHRARSHPRHRCRLAERPRGR